jgi:tetratricopeptide (TPR) repeat protein
MHTQQPLSIFPLPTGYLLLPALDQHETALADLLQGRMPTNMPKDWQFYQAAYHGDTATALALLASDTSAEAHYNQFVLNGSAETYPTVRRQLPAEFVPLLDMVAYTMGLLAAPPDPENTTGTIRATLLAAQAAAALETDDYARAQAQLAEAIDLARPLSPLLAAQLLSDQAETRIAMGKLDALALQPYREALQLLAESGLTEQRAQSALRLGTLYHELARGQRGPLLEAVRYYQEALRFFTRDNHAEAYALAQNNLALAYLAMPMVEASDQLRMAIAVQALREAATVYTKTDYPERWASVQLNLANALQYLPSGFPEEHLIEAVQIYEELLASREQVSDLPGYARLLANQGNALAHLGIFVHARPKLAEAARRFAALGDQDAVQAIQATLADIETREVAVTE